MPEHRAQVRTSSLNGAKGTFGVGFNSEIFFIFILLNQSQRVVKQHEYDLISTVNCKPL